MDAASVSHPKLDELIAVLARLRAPGGCAWDREQTHESLVTHLVEESYELVDAIESGGRADLIEELGDVLYQVVFHADIAANDPVEAFDLEDVAAHMTAKMIGRHPHVFGDAVATTAGEVVALWDELKAIEKPARSSVLDGIPPHLPSLQRADKLLGRAAKIGVVDTAWERPGAPTAGEDEPGEGAAASALGEDELGDALLAMVADARSQGLDAERALRGATRRLEQRIRDAEVGS